MPDVDVGDARGQSELFGFLLIFSVVVLTIALVGITGFVGLDSARDFQRTTNAEQGFTTLANNVDDVARGRAPSRTTEIRIADASLSLEPTETTITITGENGTSTTNVTTHPIVYDSGTGTTLTYRSGALVRRDEGGELMFRNPDYVLTEERVVLPVVNTTASGAGPVGGSTAVAVGTEASGTTLLAANAPVDNVTIAMTTPHADAWARYFEEHETDGPVTTVDQNGNEVEVTIETNRAYVTVHDVSVTFQ